MNEKNFGFTLLEILVVLAIVAIITAIAVPSYKSYIIKSKRHDAINSLNLIALSQERFYNDNGAFSSSLSGLNDYLGDYLTDEYNYTVTSPNTLIGYVITAAAKANSSQLDDTEGGVNCSTITLTVSGLNRTEAPSQCWD